MAPIVPRSRFAVTRTGVLSSVALAAVVIGRGAVSTRPSIPPPVSANTLELRAKISGAVGTGHPATVTVPPDTYVFSNASLVITGANNLVIDAVGATFVFYIGFGVVLNDCHNVTLRGLTLDSDPPNFAQGALVHGAGQPVATAMTFEAQFDDAFLAPDPRLPPFDHPGGLVGAKVRLFDPATRLPLLTLGGFLNASDHITGSQFRIHLHPPGLTEPSAVPEGALVAVYPRRGVTVQLSNSSGVLVEDVTIHAGGNMGFHEQFGEGGNVYRRVAIVRKPGWSGLLALNADGFHSSDVGTGPTLEDSTISFTGDDFVNVHNKMLVICEPISTSSTDRLKVERDVSNVNGRQDTHGAGQGGNPHGDDSERGTGVRSLHIVDLSGGGLSDLRSGDQMRFYKLMGGVVTAALPYLGVGEVQARSPVTDPSTLQACRQASEAMKEPPYNAKLVVSFGNAPVYRVDFTDDLPPNVTSTKYNLVNFERRSGANAVLRNNTFFDASGSGGRIIAKARGMRVLNNTASRYEEPEWLEGELGLRDVLVDGNTIIDPVSESNHVDVMRGLTNITCTDNTFIVHGTKTVRPSGC